LVVLLRAFLCRVALRLGLLREASRPFRQLPGLVALSSTLRFDAAA
jgi:hypothetical protein